MEELESQRNVVIEEKINMYLKYVVFYNNECPPTKGDFLTFLNHKGEFFESWNNVP